MMRVLVILVAFLMFSASLAVAQTHPCDLTYPTSGTGVVGPHPLKLCHPGTDASGTAPVTSWELYIDGAGGATITMTTNGIANAAGLKEYTATVQALLGTHTYEVSAVNSIGESAKSAPFTFVATPAPTAPASPVKVRVG